MKSWDEFNDEKYDDNKYINHISFVCLSVSNKEIYYLILSENQSILFNNRHIRLNQYERFIYYKKGYIIEMK